MYLRGGGYPQGGGDWSSDFVYAKSLKVAPPERRGPRTSIPTQRSEEWLCKSMRDLGKRSFSGYLSPKDQEELHRRLASAGREFNKGYITEDAYHTYVGALLRRRGAGKENGEPAPWPKPSHIYRGERAHSWCTRTTRRRQSHAGCGRGS